MKDKLMNMVKKWLKESIMIFVLLLVIFEIFFYKEGLKPVGNAITMFFLVVVPGTMFTSNMFGKKFKRYELMLMGLGFGMILIPSIIYFINIFDVLHARYLIYLVPIGMFVLLGWIYLKKVGAE